jgi:hypothetical protein
MGNICNSNPDHSNGIENNDMIARVRLNDTNLEIICGIHLL